ncbi:MAG: enoyl-CoA hydratase/isomerase family protein [Elusimicrobia bacterium]|nr:enoyl-CoA hydratase/isomerase family protein [Elusimicrobiota bacterium]
MPYQNILVTEGAAAEVVLNRPQVRNAMDDAMLRELTAAFKALAKKKDLRAVVVRGAGRDFCAGADIHWMRRAGKLPPAKSRQDAKLLLDMALAVDACPVPVVASLHGNVFGGGLGLASACDIVVAEENARMSFSEARLGIIPAVISCFVLPKIGEAQARRYYLTGEIFNMKTAKHLGIVHEVTHPDELAERTGNAVKNILKNGPNAVREAKALLRKFPALNFNARAKLVLDTLTRLRRSPEGQEGLSAFLEKRPASWVPPSSAPEKNV